MHGTLGGADQRARVDRLGQIARGPVLHRLHGALHHRAGGHQDQGNVDVAGAHRPQQLDAVHARHGDVADHQVELPALERLDRLPAVAGSLDVKARRGQGASQHPQQRLLVVYQQNPIAHQKTATAASYAVTANTTIALSARSAAGFKWAYVSSGLGSKQRDRASKICVSENGLGMKRRTFTVDTGRTAAPRPPPIFSGRSSDIALNTMTGISAS